MQYKSTGKKWKANNPKNKKQTEKSGFKGSFKLFNSCYFEQKTFKIKTKFILSYVISPQQYEPDAYGKFIGRI